LGKKDVEGRSGKNESFHVAAAPTCKSLDPMMPTQASLPLACSSSARLSCCKDVASRGHQALTMTPVGAEIVTWWSKTFASHLDHPSSKLSLMQGFAGMTVV
jgi:hypothetical protein